MKLLLFEIHANPRFKRVCTNHYHYNRTLLAGISPEKHLANDLH
jgi:hypothetical protein